VIDGYRIPAGTLSTYTCHRNPVVWDNPTVFDPERFSESRALGRHSFAWLPFGAGQRTLSGTRRLDDEQGTTFARPNYPP
jgi:cytochrome P450